MAIRTISASASSGYRRYFSGLRVTHRASGAGLTGISDGERIGGNIDVTLVDSNGGARLRVEGAINRWREVDLASSGASILCRTGIGSVTATTGQSEAELQAELPDGFSITVSGTTFTKTDFISEAVVTIGSQQYKEFRVGNEAYFGGSVLAIIPAYERWAAITYTAGARVRSSDPSIDLITTAGGTDTFPEPVPDGDYGDAVSGGTLTDWIQTPADRIEILLNWSDTSLDGTTSESVREFITKSYKTARIIAQTGETLDAHRQNHGLSLLNDMLHGWDIDGVGVNHVDLTIDNSMPYEKGHLVYLRYCLAMELVLDTGNEVTSFLYEKCLEGKEIMREYFDQAPELAVDAALHPYYNANRRF